MAAALRFFSSMAAKTPDFGFGRPILFPSLSSICLELVLPTIPLGALDEAFRACFAATADDDDDEGPVTLKTIGKRKKAERKRAQLHTGGHTLGGS